MKTGPEWPKTVSADHHQHCSSFIRCHYGLVSMRLLPPGTLTLARLAATAWPELSSPACRRSSRTKKARSKPSSALLRAFGCGAGRLPA
ncbi:hypothetical protein [Novosphingobium resinovorum]|uniref:hypothetical protein n=1 Tax=Novosphingobium resinovorum TaxID=158500 RepID=UPI0012DF267A|nr:hypothetical protein [Novosphingobium resinovorum]